MGARQSMIARSVSSAAASSADAAAVRQAAAMPLEVRNSRRERFIEGSGEVVMAWALLKGDVPIGVKHQFAAVLLIESTIVLERSLVQFDSQNRRIGHFEPAVGVWERLEDQNAR